MNQQPAEHDDELPVPPAEAGGSAAEHVQDAEEIDDDGPVELADPFEGDENAKPVEEVVSERSSKPAADMQWFILKVQSNREDSIRETLLRRISLQGLGEQFGEVIVPKEQVTDFKGARSGSCPASCTPATSSCRWCSTTRRGISSGRRGHRRLHRFGGPAQSHAAPGRRQTPQQEGGADGRAPRLKINFKKGDKVKINEGTFENFEGEVEQIDESNGRVTVMLSIFGRSTPVDIEYWQIESV